MPIEPAPIGPPAYSECLPRTRESARPARAMVTSALRVWDLEEYADSAQSIVTELIANAAAYGSQSLVRVTVTLTGPDSVRIGVVDRSAVLPERHTAGEDDESGRGLAIIDSLTGGCWGVDQLPWGKRVWAEIGVKS
ncbi:ATP-binding protein [Streptomyces sp. NPDC096136]|uniref:ATP-binding protein n=1 Tax=Streptomyces sp. NPDC096136 TaxID=3366076 RepID=UPI0037FCFADE